MSAGPSFSLAQLLECSDVRASADSYVRLRNSGLMRTKPLLGGAFSGGMFHLCSVCWTTSGLHEIEYVVIDEPSSFVIARGATKSAVLAAARQALSQQWQRDMWAALFARLVADRARHAATLDAGVRARLAASAATSPRTPTVSRRRRAIFEKSGGRCHYCACELQLDGRWHVEHMIPRALGGRSEDANLVAACAPCNHSKADKTDHEFIAARELLVGRGR